MAETRDWARIEQSIHLMADLPLDTRAVVSACRFDKDSLIFRRGDRPRAMYAVVSGEARLLRTSASGVDVILQRTRSGMFAEASLDQPRYHCDAVAAVPTELIASPRKAFRLALANDAFRERWLALLLRELRRLRAEPAALPEDCRGAHRPRN
jgi:CRP/FNR family transcriptional regulator, dissimilatory nitrate respiration regulator